MATTTIEQPRDTNAQVQKKNVDIERWSVGVREEGEEKKKWGKVKRARWKKAEEEKVEKPEHIHRKKNISRIIEANLLECFCFAGIFVYGGSDAGWL